MTLTDVLQAIFTDRSTSEFMEKSPESTMCELVTSAITQAAREGRLTHGLNDCVDALSRKPNDVVICILPVDTTSSHVNLDIQMLLIESVCVEYDILILKVDINEIHSELSHCTDLAQVGMATLMNRNENVPSELDCFLIQHGDDGLSFSEKKLLSIPQAVPNPALTRSLMQDIPELYSSDRFNLSSVAIRLLPKM
ncbi:growth arrest and DNA damage-inducible protein GADD45 gamma [Biomphalaria pfeifferi]|uniref:Growth arrest and DNA damage-inducible protein GADD45 gamma n=1 Tax=Biomphalaria pfeifferi TaxID=112525 RepID=A0AAD8CBA4_BIOPF|nr:growth arrest and DNA damage-inducible protein GADD45 gamma [Biomphalaria pfeifferi]